MAFFSSKHRKNAYFLSLRDMGNSDNNVYARFDTGAINTVFSLDNITAGDVDAEKFEELIKKQSKEKMFHSVTGDEIIGYPVVAENVYIAGSKFEKFFYYLVVNTKENIALIGDDFISKCKFYHEVNGDIVVDSFDYEQYENDFVDAMSENRVSELFDLCSVG